ncbi:MAG TPA: hypothetical protein PK379_00035 [Candidatus Hydrogenedentes bacterium]|nr:hypothetical protein [Candidatus Hydrogenedentota bacterium]HOJ67796.1 hypothetical protein [Candidatus Hydrogenedentota bacterium]HOK88390.1 hypothetical protein [Candidatus Hydrogenedentota bacterium]HOV62068.1 hypothetical protein [Candidatus Hydrogenedentota bacterium]
MREEALSPRCHHCGAPWPGDKPRPAFRDTCPQCGAYWHCCLNCRFHDPSAHNQCRIPTTEWVGDRRKFNYCDDFAFRTVPPENPEKSGEARRKAFELLGEPEPGRPSFEDLFKDDQAP